MHCCICGRTLKRAAAVIPARYNHPAGDVGPTCARKAGLIHARPALFVSARRRAQRATRQTAQLELL